MKRYKVVVSRDKTDFFLELMNRLGIRVEHESLERSDVSTPKAKEKQVVGAMDRKEDASALKADTSIKDVLKKIEELRGRH